MYRSLNKGIISARTGKNTVAIVGFAKNTRHLVPYEDKDTEIWGINDAYITKDFMQRWDRWFQIHPLDYLATQDGTPRDHEHIEWLKQKHDFPIYMLEKFEDMPSSVEYPLEKVLKKIGRRYITSSFGIMFGMAMLEGFERIEIYGFDMKTFTEYAHQRPNTEYLIGKAEGMGIDVYIPNLSSLCRGPLYGYESLDISFRQELEYRHMGLEASVTRDTNTFHRLDSRYNTLKEMMKKYPEDKKLKKQTNLAHSEAETMVASINNTLGRVQQLVEIMAVYDDIKNKEIQLEEMKYE